MTNLLVVGLLEKKLLDLKMTLKSQAEKNQSGLICCLSRCLDTHISNKWQKMGGKEGGKGVGRDEGHNSP